MPSLSPTDRDLIARLQRVEVGWRYYRWLVLTFAVVLLGAGTYLARTSWQGVGDISTSSSDAGSFSGVALLLACRFTKNAVMGELLSWAGIYLLAFLFVRWSGSTDRALLLRALHLLDSSESTASAQVPNRPEGTASSQ